MKKRVLLSALLSFMVFSMVACGKKEDVGTINTTPAEIEAPTSEPTVTTTPEPTAESTEEPIVVPTPKAEDINDDAQEMSLKLELKETDNVPEYILTV